MMMSSNEHIFRVTGALWGESIGQQWIPITKARDAELWYFVLPVPEQMVGHAIETPVVWDATALIMTSPSWKQRTLTEPHFILWHKEAIYRVYHCHKLQWWLRLPIMIPARLFAARYRVSEDLASTGRALSDLPTKITQCIIRLVY